MRVRLADAFTRPALQTDHVYAPSFCKCECRGLSFITCGTFLVSAVYGHFSCVLYLYPSTCFAVKTGQLVTCDMTKHAVISVLTVLKSGVGACNGCRDVQCIIQSARRTAAQ